MGDTSVSSSSSIGAIIGRQLDDLNKARAATSAGFASVLNNVEIAVGLKPKTGFTTSGATYEANTVTGKTKAAFGNVVDITKSVLHIKP